VEHKFDGSESDVAVSRILDFSCFNSLSTQCYSTQRQHFAKYGGSCSVVGPHPNNLAYPTLFIALQPSVTSASKHESIAPVASIRD
jgi:hypothetical protein